MYQNFLKNLKILVATLVTFFIAHYLTGELIVTIVITNLVACLLGVVCYEFRMGKIINTKRSIKQKIKTFSYLFLMWCVISMIGIYTVVLFLNTFFTIDIDNTWLYIGIYSFIAGIGIEVDHYLLKRAFFILK